MFKVYVENNYFFVQDATALYEGLKKDVRVNISSKTESDPKVSFSNIKDWNDEKTIKFSQIVDENDDAFADIQSFVDFYTANTGNFNRGGSAPDLSNKWKKEQLSGFTYQINIDNNELSYYELYFVKDDRSKDFSDPNFEVTNNSITINSGFPLDGVVCFYRKIEL